MADEIPVTVIIPAYNRASSAVTALMSIRDQRHRPLDVIVVDDGSTDDTEQAVSSVSDRLRASGIGLSYVKKQNGGACSARNQGISLAKGDLIQFLDADDYLCAGKIDRQVEEFRRSGKPSNVLLYGSWKLSFERTGDAPVVQSRQKEALPAAGSREYIKAFLEGWWCPPHVYLWPRPLVDLVGDWDIELKADQDGDYFFRALVAGAELRFCQGACVVYRQHASEQISTSVSLASCQSRWRALRKMEAALKDDGTFQLMKPALAERAYGLFELAASRYPAFARDVRLHAKQAYGSWPSRGSVTKKLVETLLGSRITYRWIEKRNAGNVPR